MKTQTRNKTAQIGPWPDPWSMAGTEGTGEYRVAACSKLARIGFRRLPGGSVRTRVELASRDNDLRSRFAEAFSRVEGWKQPDLQQNRFSIVTHDDDISRLETLEEHEACFLVVHWFLGEPVVRAYRPVRPKLRPRKTRRFTAVLAIAALAVAAVRLRRKA